MDLSGMIFIALAVCWAVYLIPKALHGHEELARSRSVDSFSSRLRVFGGSAPVGADAEVALPTAVSAPGDQPLSRATARRAAARRRRVLLALVLLVLATVVAWYLGYAPVWSVAIPAGLVVAFLVIARLTVRRERAARFVATPAVAPAADPEPTEDTVGIVRTEVKEYDEPLVDDAALWDPLPLNLPTYVTKPVTRRTVRTIELTGSLTSSGHDAADSALARAHEAEKAAAAAPDEAPAIPEQRHAAGA